MTFDLAQAEQLAEVVKKTGVVFAVSHNYTGYPLVRQAREMVRAGELGEIQAVRAVLHPGLAADPAGEQRPEAGRLAHRPQALGHRRLLRRHRHARLQPRPVHHRPAPRADQLPPAQPSSRAARSTTTAPPSSASTNGGLGTVTASQISPRPRKRPVDRGRRHEGGARVAPGGAEQDDRPRRTASRTRSTRAAGGPYLGRRAGASIAHPGGHPEAFLEAFANIYTAAYADMALGPTGKTFDGGEQPVPQRGRRRRWHELHHAVRRVEQRGRGVEDAEAPAVPVVR